MIMMKIGEVSMWTYKWTHHSQLWFAHQIFWRFADYDLFMWFKGGGVGHLRTHFLNLRLKGKGNPVMNSKIRMQTQMQTQMQVRKSLPMRMSLRMQAQTQMQNQTETQTWTQTWAMTRARMKTKRRPWMMLKYLMKKGLWSCETLCSTCTRSNTHQVLVWVQL